MVRTRLRRLVDSALTSGQLQNWRTELVNSGSSSCPFYTNPDMTQFRRRIPSAPLGLARVVLPHTPIISLPQREPGTHSLEGVFWIGVYPIWQVEYLICRNQSPSLHEKRNLIPTHTDDPDNASAVFPFLAYHPITRSRFEQ